MSKKATIKTWKHLGDGIYDHKSGRFTIELLGDVAYLHDTEIIPVTKYVFKDLTQAKMAASKILRGKTVVSTVSDPFEVLGQKAVDLIAAADKLLRQSEY